MRLPSKGIRLFVALAITCLFAGDAVAAGAGGDTKGFTLAELASFAMNGDEAVAGSLDADRETAPPTESLTEALFDGKVHFNLRARYEYADITGLQVGHAGTARLRLGYGTKPLHGISAYGEVEGTATVDNDAYNSLLNGRATRSVIADPRGVELNQLFGKYEKYGATVIGGRQRIIFDDARFVGNVGWRQDEQTFDAGLVGYRGEEGSPFENFGITYAYLWRINRILSNDRDWDSDSHLINAWYDGLEAGKVTVFGYLLDFTDDAPVAEGNTVGIRFAGRADLGEDFALKYAGSFAHQFEAGASHAFEAQYYLVDGGVTYKPWRATLGVGFETLGSDRGLYGFQTPLATGHKFQGFADAFLATPATGIQDLYPYVAAKLPWDINAKVIGHMFWEHSGGDSLGYEIDGVATKALTQWMSITAKLAYLDGNGDNGTAPADRLRLTIQTDIKF